MMRTLFAIAFILALTSCTGVVGKPPEKEKGPGSILTGKDTQGISLFDTDKNTAGETSLPINALLWRASLDIASSIPLDDIDAFGGTIVTEWYQLDDNTDERIKLAIFVLDRELRSDGIRVVVYVQKRHGNDWRDEGTDSEMGNRLEDLILTRAREIRAAAVSETN